MYGRIERSTLTAKTASMASSSPSKSSFGGHKDRPAYYKVPSENVSHLYLEMPQLRVTEGGKADRVGLKLGDSIIQINDQDTTDMALQDAQKLIEITTNQQLKLKVQNIDDEEETGHAEVRDILLMTEKKPKLEAKDGSPQPNPPVAQWIPPKPERKAWHPVMWQETQPQHDSKHNHQVHSSGADAPHARIIRNIRRLLTETENNPVERQKHIEHMLLALPTASKI